MKDIKELFKESRRVDRAAAPSFRSMTSARRKAPKPNGWRVAVLAVASATAAGALALALFTLPRLENEPQLQARHQPAPVEPAPIAAIQATESEVVAVEPEVVAAEPDVVPEATVEVRPQRFWRPGPREIATGRLYTVVPG